MNRPFCEWTIEELQEWLSHHSFPRYHADQIFNWVYQKGILNWQKMTNLSSTLKDKLSEVMPLNSLQLVRMIDSGDGETFKFLWSLPEGGMVESVLICSGTRRTVCVSSQVGCPAGCAFCASGKGGFLRNLRAYEIVDQVLAINEWLMAKQERVSHVVYMGMGEPFKNYDQVIKSILLLTDEKLLNLSQRRITVSTVGIIEGIKRFTQEQLQVNLVLSLHAPNQHIRQKIIPYARKYPLDQILEAMDEFSSRTKRDVTFEYTLIEGINTHPDHALELAQLLKGRQCTVNLIPYNPVPGVKLTRPSKKAIKDFRSVLFGYKIVNTCRYTKGDDIAAACGQLALHHKEEPNHNSSLPLLAEGA